MRPAGYFWDDATRPAAIEIDLPVVERLGFAALEAFKSVPHRGLEIGGLLLGSRETRDGRTVIRIEDYAEVPSEHRYGPSYALSETDLQNFERALTSHPKAIGIYRTDTHAGHLTLHEDDGPLFERYLSASGGV